MNVLSVRYNKENETFDMEVDFGDRIRVYQGCWPVAASDPETGTVELKTSRQYDLVLPDYKPNAEA